MPNAPEKPKIYHITHVNNLPGIIEADKLWSDAMRLQQGLGCELVGLSNIKHRRLYDIEVSCHPGTKVGDYVPFYFCPRSIMLYIIHMGNYPELSYSGGQGPIVHLVADLHDVVEWAESVNKKWAFTDCNAGAYYAEFLNDLDKLHELNWESINATDFRSYRIKEGKQAEFLMHEWFPWHLIEKIGVLYQKVADDVQEIIADSFHQPAVRVEPDWYY